MFIVGVPPPFPSHLDRPFIPYSRPWFTVGRIYSKDVKCVLQKQMYIGTILHRGELFLGTRSICSGERLLQILTSLNDVSINFYSFFAFIFFISLIFHVRFVAKAFDVSRKVDDEA